MPTGDNSLPRRCGIATFTTDLQQAIASTGATSDTAFVAMTDEGRDYHYPPVVRLQVHDQKVEDYVRAARFLNAQQFEVVSLQHEFGIFGGDTCGHVVTLLAGLSMPVVTTLHTVLAQPTPVQRRVLLEILDISTSVVVMAEKSRQLLCSGGQDPYYPARHSRLRLLGASGRQAWPRLCRENRHPHLWADLT